MKRIFNRALCFVHCASFIALVAIIMIGCKPKPEPTPERTILTPDGTSRPEWKVTIDEESYKSMTAIIRLPEVLRPYADANDLISVVAGETIVGVASPWDEVPDSYIIRIADPHDAGPLTLRYYSVKLTRVYAAPFVSFVNDDIVGTVEEPFIPDLQ
ncbi:MAG: hypothetical protein MJZ75_07270 [Paludibacteraceae bacterium]|nr:hypothetical protein [Paludibacteraceae bacterium]